MICFKLYRTYSNQTLSIRQMLANVFWVFIVKDCIEVQEKKKKVVVLCSRSPQNVDLGRIFTCQSCSDGKKMYKKAWCTCIVVFCQSKPVSIAFVRSRCRYRRRRRCFSSLLFINVFALQRRLTRQQLSLKESSCPLHVLYGTRKLFFLSCSRPLQNPWN